MLDSPRSIAAVLESLITGVSLLGSRCEALSTRLSVSLAPRWGWVEELEDAGRHWAFECRVVSASMLPTTSPSLSTAATVTLLSPTQ